jgi:hypothetical protein
MSVTNVGVASGNTYVRQRTSHDVLRTIHLTDNQRPGSNNLRIDHSHVCHMDGGLSVSLRRSHNPPLRRINRLDMDSGQRKPCFPAAASLTGDMYMIQPGFSL